MTTEPTVPMTEPVKKNETGDSLFTNAAHALKGVISPKAEKELEGITKDLSEKIHTVGKTRIPDSLAISYLDSKLEKAVDIILTDLDRADGKEDGKISKALVEKKLAKAVDSLHLDKEKFSTTDITKKIHEAVEKLPSSAKDARSISKSALEKSLDEKIEGLVKNVVTGLDVDHDGSITKKDTKLYMEKLLQSEKLLNSASKIGVPFDVDTTFKAPGSTPAKAAGKAVPIQK